MRVLTFLHSFEPGGVERVALRLVRQWRSLGIDAPLFMGRVSGPLREEIAADLDFTTPTQPSFGSAWWETGWMILKLPAHVRRTRPDVIFCAGSTYTIVAVMLKLLLGRRCPPIMAKISNDLKRTDLPRPARMAWRRWLRIQARFIDRWIVMENAIVADVTALLGPVDHIVIRDPEIDVRLPPRMRRPKRGVDRVCYVAVGRLAHQKDYPMMLEAFATGATPEDTLTIIGDGPLRDPLRRQAHKLGIATRVSFVGHVPDAARLLHDYDVLLLSSRYEGVPAVLIEALAAGLAIVSTDSGPGVRALLDGGRLGALVPSGDVVGFASALRAAPTRPIDQKAGLAQARRFTIEGASRRYLMAMEELAGCSNAVARSNTATTRIAA